MDTGLPTLIVVTGRPGAGKSTLVPLLAKAIRCPAVSRDEIKEGLVNTVGGALDVEVALATNEAFFDTIRLLLERKVTLAAEAAFQHRLWAPRLEELQKIAKVRIVVCSINVELARSRHAERSASDASRGRYHDVGPLAETYDPPGFDLPTLIVDTSDGYRPGFEEIVAFANG
ncbi:ATP-binding protein [bacterium]|nr:MAG: ATP-binding protein [bacterium]